jgi:hypothetical protein
MLELLHISSCLANEKYPSSSYVIVFKLTNLVVICAAPIGPRWW